MRIQHLDSDFVRYVKMVQVDLVTAGAVFAIILLIYHYLAKKYENFLPKPVPCIKPSFVLGSTGPMMFCQRDVSSHLKWLYNQFPDFKYVFLPR